MTWASASHNRSCNAHVCAMQTEIRALASASHHCSCKTHVCAIQADIMTWASARHHCSCKTHVHAIQADIMTWASASHHWRCNVHVCDIQTEIRARASQQPSFVFLPCHVQHIRVRDNTCDKCVLLAVLHLPCTCLAHHETESAQLVVSFTIGMLQRRGASVTCAYDASIAPSLALCLLLLSTLSHTVLLS